MQELDGFIDQALLNNMAQVDIIHGLGQVIREGVTKYLRRRHFEYAPKSEAARLLRRLKDKLSPSCSSARSD